MAEFIRPTLRIVRRSRIWLATLAGLGIYLGCNPQPPYLKKNVAPKGANGIAFDRNGLLYIASLRANEIIVVDASTGAIKRKLGLEQGVESPDDVAFGPDGSLYWTSLDSGKVCRLSPRGLRSEQMIAPGVNPIAFSDSGRLFVAVAYKGDALYELDPFFLQTPRVIVRDLGWLNGMAWGSDDYLYAPVWSKGQVVRIDVDSAQTVLVADGFKKPAAVKFDSRGHLHVVDYETGLVWQIDIQTGSKRVLIRLSPHLDNLTFDSQDRLFVSNADRGDVYEILLQR